MNVAQAACGAGAACLLKCRVLLAEDIDSNAGWEQDALELFGCHVVRARDGVVAVNLGTSSQFDLILMDGVLTKPFIEKIDAQIEKLLVCDNLLRLTEFPHDEGKRTENHEADHGTD